jgi:carboxyl-terminal processing protease
MHAPFLLLAVLPLALQEPQAAWRSDFEAAGAAPPSLALQLADAAGAAAEDADFAAAQSLLEQAEGTRLLFLVRFLGYGPDEPGSARLVTLLDSAQPSLTLAAIATLARARGEDAKAVQRGLGAWLLDHPVEKNPEIWIEGQLALFRCGDGTYRSAALRNLRGLVGTLEPDLQNRAVLALGRSGVVLDPRELELLTQLAAGADANAVLARALLDRQQDLELHRRKEAALLKLLDEQGAAAAGNDPALASLAQLADVLRMLQAHHMEGEEYTREELLEAAADGIFGRLDPFSDYMSSEDVADFKYEMDPQYGGIGAYVNTINGVFTIVRPIYSGPAYRAGLLSNDKVIEVDGWSTAEQPNDEVIRRLKGKPGTSVMLKVWRPGWNEPREFTVPRAKIEVPLMEQEMLPGRVLYLELVSFGVDSAPAIEQAIRAAQQEAPLAGVVLDLRNNPGGYLESAVEICNVFLPRDKLVVSTKSRGDEERHYTTKAALVPEQLPLALLVNDLSASASEIVAGALRVHGRAVLVGERTVGKGSVQQMYRLPGSQDEPWQDQNRNHARDDWESFTDVNGNGKHDYAPLVKITMAYYYLPDGSWIHTIRDHDGRVTKAGGVQPDHEVRFPEFDYPTLRELDRLIGKDAFRTYAQQVYNADPVRAVRLAEFDDRQTASYLGWLDFYAGLGTSLDQQEVRRWVRRALRGVVSDARGKVFPGGGFYGDFEEDPQLQQGIRLILEQAGKQTSEFPEYRALAKSETDADAAVTDGGR